VLLPKSLNASIGNLAYEDKVTYYRQENLLTASLHQETYGNRGNPGFKKFLKQNKFHHVLRAYDKFGASAVDTREQLYRHLCELIWRSKEFGIPDAPAGEQVRVPRRPRTQYGVELADLIDVGMLEGNTPIVGRSKEGQYAAIILTDGRVRVETGETFSSLSAAGRFVRGAKSCAGWSFWNLRRDDALVPLERIRAHALEEGLVEPRR
jgi:Restriction Enzyme Adenine Methylase Associated